MKNYKMTIAYDGSGYYGYQRQPRHMTIQEVLERTLSKLFKMQIKINGSGRTDTGVHALGQVINFTSELSVPLDKLPFAINNLLPPDIRVCAVEHAAAEFHARYSARGKHYRYKILQTKQINPFMQRYMWQLEQPLDLEAMQRATMLIRGEHDFTTFRSTGSIQGSAVRHVNAADWQLKDLADSGFGIESDVCGQVYAFDIYGNGFLYHMVRNLVGTIAQVGMGKMSVSEFEVLFNNKRRVNKCITAPPQGLYLVRVEY